MPLVIREGKMLIYYLSHEITPGSKDKSVYVPLNSVKDLFIRFGDQKMMEMQIKDNDELYAWQMRIGAYIKLDDSLEIFLDGMGRGPFEANNRNAFVVQFRLVDKDDNKSEAYYIELSDDYRIFGGKELPEESQTKIKSFFRENLVLLAGLWDNQLKWEDLLDYFAGFMNLKDFLQRWKFYDNYKKDFKAASNMREVEKVVRKHEIFELYDKRDNIKEII